jgi:hypothetical protein
VKLKISDIQIFDTWFSENLYCLMLSTERIGIAARLLIRVQEELGLNLGRDIGYTD